ncbi:unnamed protein product, partial [Vicia faba]
KQKKLIKLSTSMAFSKSFIFALLFVVTMTSMNIEARQLLQTTALPHPTIPAYLPDFYVMSSFPKGSLPPLDNFIQSLPKHIMSFPFPSVDLTIDVPPVSAPAPALVSDTPNSPPSFFSFFPFFSKTLSISNP